MNSTRKVKIAVMILLFGMPSIINGILILWGYGKMDMFPFGVFSVMSVAFGLFVMTYPEPRI